VEDPQTEPVLATKHNPGTLAGKGAQGD
jgi:hypothetical protein